MAVDHGARTGAVEARRDWWVNTKALFDNSEEIREGLSGVSVNHVRTLESCTNFLGKVV